MPWAMKPIAIHKKLVDSRYSGASGSAINAGMIIAQRRPILSAIQPQPHDDRNKPRLAKKIGVATSPGERCRSFCRWVANSALTE